MTREEMREIINILLVLEEKLQDDLKLINESKCGSDIYIETRNLIAKVIKERNEILSMYDSMHDSIWY